MDFVDFAKTNGVDIWEIAKWFYVLGFVVYFVFSIIAWRQIDLMSKSLNGSLQIPIKLIGMCLVLLSGVAMVMSVMIL